MINKQEEQAVPMFVPSISSPDPLRRWQKSPPEDKLAPLSAITYAIQDSWFERSPNEDFTTVEHQQGIPDPGFVDDFQIYRRSESRAASTTSAESAFQSDTNASGGDHKGRSDLLGQLQVQVSGLNSYMQVLTGHLSHYAEEQRRLSIVPTDEMLQREARRLMFDSEDSWNQTIADHPQWQAAFREKWSSSTT